MATVDNFESFVIRNVIFSVLDRKIRKEEASTGEYYTKLAPDPTEG